MGSHNSPLSRPNVLTGSRSSPQSTWYLTIHPFQGPTSSLALVSLPNRCEISQSTPFRAQRPHWLLFLSPINVVSHDPPFKAQCPHCLSFLSPINVVSHNPPLSKPNVLASSRSSLQSTWYLTIHPFQSPTSSLALVPLSNRHGISQSTPLKTQRPHWLSFLPPIDMVSHNPPLSRPNILTGSRSSLQSTWYLTIHPFQGPTSSLALVPLSNQRGISQSTPFMNQHPHSLSFLSTIILMLQPISNPQKA